MKQVFYFQLILFCINLQAFSQSVVVSNSTGSALDPAAMLEVRKPLKAKLNLRSLNFLDTAWLQLSNRTAAGAGSDFNILANGEEGLYFNTRSDLPGFVNDSLFTMLRTGNIGIGTKTPTAKLDIVGSLRIRDGNEGLGKILVSSANGTGGWQPGPIGFETIGSFPAISNFQSISAGVLTDVTVFNNEESDLNNLYNPLTGIVTIPVSGTYHVDVNLGYTNCSSGNYTIYLQQISTGGTVFNLRIAKQTIPPGAVINHNLQLAISCNVSLTAGIRLRIATEHNASGSQLIYGGSFSWFNVHRAF